MRILLVEADHPTARTIELVLTSEGFIVYSADTGEEGVDLAKIYDYDLILLDLNLPDMSGLEVLRQLRVGKVNTPVMILSGPTDIETKVKTFGGGADDYLTKPFHKDELICRANAIIRRSKGHAQAIVEIGDVAINLDAKIVTVGGKSVHLTGKEYMMIELLALRLGQTITKEMFLNHLYGGMDEPELKIIDVFICKVRKKLKDAGGGRHIETVWGRGYRLMKTPSGDDWKRPKALATQMVILNRLSHGQPETSGDVATHTRVEVTQIRPALSRLAAAGLVEMMGRPPHSAWRILPAGREAHTKETAAVAATA